MPALSIRRFPDPILKQPTRPVERVDAAVTAFLDSLIRTMRSHPRCVGLAAPQVGRPLRIAAMDASGHPKTTDGHDLLVLVNPRIIATDGAVIGREGCLSIPDFTANVRRAARVQVKARDRFGSTYQLWLDGFEAIVVQHEIDHLDGKLFLDRVVNIQTDVFRRKTYV